MPTKLLLALAVLAVSAACDRAGPANNVADRDDENIARDCYDCGPYGELITDGVGNDAAAEPDQNIAAPAPNPCLMQGSERLNVRPLRAVGTEPFWGARIEGRCVTYSHPEDQAGTRVWTRYAASAGGGTWIGELRGHPFRLRTHSQPGCSDGMSDKSYPLAVDLTVDGENRTGCAEPL